MLKVTLISIILIIVIGAFALCANSEEEIRWDDLVEAIYKAEGGEKSAFFYGIVSIPYQDKAEARKICMNTCKNNWKRFHKQTKYTDYIEFLGSRYCPVGAKNDPQGLNKNWVKNVRYFYNKGGK